MDGFDFSAHLERLCRDIVRRLPEYRHIDMERVGVGFRQTRQPALHGIYATLTPLRFAEGRTTLRKRGRDWMVQKVYRREGTELLYLLNFFLPRFLNLPFREKLITVCHELWHISEKFDGDVRRHAGRCYAHGSSKEKYDQTMDRHVTDWLALEPATELYGFLHLNATALTAQHGRIFGRKWPRPKLVLVGKAS